MFRRTLFIVLALALLASTTIFLGATTNNDAEAANAAAKKEISAVLKAHEENWNRHDMDAWANAILHDD